MFVIKKMRLNKFQPHPYTSNKALFLAKGECPAFVESKATSDCLEDPSIIGATKLQLLKLAEESHRRAYLASLGEPKEPLKEDIKTL